MNNPIGMTIGALHKWTDSINEQLNILRKCKVKNIEVLFSKITDLDEKISKKNIAYLTSLNYVSIHAPFFGKNKNFMFYKNNIKTKKIIKKLEKYYELFNAKAIVFHPDQVSDWSLISKTNMRIGIENMPKRRKITKKILKGILKKSPNFKLLLDTAHALTRNPKYMNNLVRDFRKKIQHVHFSDRRFVKNKGKIKSHEQLLFCKDMKKFNILKKLNHPIIIEITIRDKIGDIKNIKKEIKHVEKFFKAKAL